MRQAFAIAVLLLAGVVTLVSGQANNKSSIVNSKHDFRAASSAQIRSSTGQDACVFCHTPHNAETGSYLWNHKLSSRDFPTYSSSSTLQSTVTPVQPQDVSKLCLSCHDGTIALGDTVNDGAIAFVQGNGYTLPASAASNLAGDQTFANDHPFGFAPRPSAEVVNPPVSDPVHLDGLGKLQCTGCHDPHKEDNDPTVRKFLVKSNQASNLCITCHVKSGWDTSVHNHPPDPSEEQRYTQTQGAHTGYTGVTNNGCESCHRPHSPQVGQRLVKNLEESTCFQCHNGSVTNRNIQAEFTGKTYKHPVLVTPSVHDAAEDSNSSIHPLPETSVGMARHSECADCHNPHKATTSGAQQPPLVSGALNGVKGQSVGNSSLPQSVNEYEVCFKCHADSANKPQSQDRGSAGIGYGRNPQRQYDAGNLNAYNTRMEFSQSVSFHPVTQARNLSIVDVPSLRPNVISPSGAPIAGRPLSGGSQIYCTDCHNSDTGRNLGSSGTGPSGVHGSNLPHILERSNALEPAPPTPGSGSGLTYTLSNYAMCDKCHDVSNSVLADKSFKKHQLHVVSQRAACSTCHDSHASSSQMLINFDRSVVAANSQGVLQYTRTSTGHGTCSLKCHGEDHNNFSY